MINQEENQILGSVIYIDNYGNVVTNITAKLFKRKLEKQETLPFLRELLNSERSMKAIAMP